MNLDKEAIRKYYTATQFEYGLIWNWQLKTTPALHFGYYDEKATNHKEALVRVNEVLADFGEIKKGATIVDAGCGLGHSSEWLAIHLDANVTGITLVPKQVKTIEKRLAKKPVKNVRFLVADFLAMPFADNSVDVVWAIESVCHAHDKLLFYKEAYRVLKPGGKLLMADYDRSSRPMTAQKETLLKEAFHTWAVPDLDTIEEHRNHSIQAGFTSFKHNDVTKHVVKSYRNLRENCKRYKGLSKTLNTLGIISSVRHNNMLGSLKMADGIEQGVFFYHHIAAEK